MDEDSWNRNHEGGVIMEEHGGGIMEEETGGVILEEETFRKHGGGIMEEESCRRNHVEEESWRWS